MRLQRPWMQVLIGGATAGVLLETMVLRLNPEIPVQIGPVLLGLVLWMSWGAFTVGLLILGMWALFRLFWPGSREDTNGTWRVPEITAGVYGVIAVLTRINADLHTVFLSGSGHRLLRQDAIAWLIGGLLVLWLGVAARRKLTGTAWRWLFVLLVLILPLVRTLGEPGSPRTIPRLWAGPLECPARPLLVLGIEGLDSRVLLTHVGVDRYPNLAQFMTNGSWGPLNPYSPYLRQSLWTSTATGAFPRRHGVKARWAWYLPIRFPGPLRLLPWTPAKSGWVLPWWLARKEVPPPSAVPPLWERLRSSDVPTTVLDWPGLWAVPPGSSELTAADGLDLLEPALRQSLEAALQRFPDEHQRIITEIGNDTARFVSANQAIAGGSRNLWVYMRSLAEVRRNLEPLRPRHVGEREVLELTLELLDQQVGALVDAVGDRALVVVVSPYGLAPPNPKERLLRLVGAGGTWRTSAHTCPDGVLALLGDGVLLGNRFTQAKLTDLSPTVCYLLGLPVPHYIDGRVILDAVEPDYLSSHPLRFVK